MARAQRPAPSAAFLVLLLALASGARAQIPPEWSSVEIAGVGGSERASATGSSEHARGALADRSWERTTGGSPDFWGRAEAGHFLSRTLEGDGAITARILAHASTSNSWAEAGLMARDSDVAGSPHFTVGMGPGYGVFQHWRPAPDAFRVYRQAPGEPGFARLTPRPLAGLAYVDENLHNGSRYRYRVTAVSGGKETLPSATAEVRPMAPVQGMTGAEIGLFTRGDAASGPERSRAIPCASRGSAATSGSASSSPPGVTRTPASPGSIG